MADINELTQRVANHLAGRPVVIRWMDPPAASAAGQIVKTASGQLVIYVANLTGVETRLKVLLHELAHARHDSGWIPVSNDHRAPAGSIPRPEAVRAAWIAHPRESRAHKQAAEWLAYAENNAHKFFTGYQTAMECRLRALLDWQPKT